jgi:hypothetical protein
MRIALLAVSAIYERPVLSVAMAAGKAKREAAAEPLAKEAADVPTAAPEVPT